MHPAVKGFKSEHDWPSLHHTGKVVAGGDQDAPTCSICPCRWGASFSIYVLCTHKYRVVIRGTKPGPGSDRWMYVHQRTKSHRVSEPHNSVPPFAMSRLPR